MVRSRVLGLERRAVLRSRFPPSALAHPGNFQFLLFQAAFPCLLLQTGGVGMVGTVKAAGTGAEVWTFPSPQGPFSLSGFVGMPGPVPSPQQGPQRASWVL